MCLIETTTGRLVLEEVDAELDGPVPLSFFRLYRSTPIFLGDLGHGWGHAFGFDLRGNGEGGMVFRGGDGRRVLFATPTPQEPSDVPVEQFAAEAIQPELIPSDDLRRELRAGAILVHRGGRPTLLFDARATGGVHPWRGLLHPSGAIVRVIPDSRGAPKVLEEPTGRLVTLERRADGLIEKITLAPGRGAPPESLVLYEYDAAKNLVGVRDRAGKRTYRYDGAHRLVTYRDRAGGETTARYDEGGRCASTVGPGGRLARTYRYDPELRRTIVEDSVGGKWTYDFTDSDQVLRSEDRCGAISTFDYDAVGRLVGATDQAGFETLLCYDGAGSPIGKIAPDGGIWRISDDGRDAIVASPCGSELRYERDERGLITAVHRPRDGTWTIGYGPDGRIATLTMPAGKTVRHTWSPDGRNLVEADDVGPVSERTYDVLDRLVVHRDPVGAVTRYVYGPDGWLHQIVFSDGRSRQFQSDPQGRVVMRRDEAGNVTRWTYDAAGRSVESIAANGDVFRSEYDSENRLVSVVAPGGLRHRYEYGPSDRVVRQEFSDGRVESYGYDVRGLLARMTDPAGEDTTIERDPVGRPIRIAYPDGTEKRFAYDPDGRWIRAEHAGCVRERTLNPEGLALTESQDGTRFEREIGPSGEVLSVLDCLANRISYAYDSEGRVIGIAVQPGRFEERTEPTERAWIADGAPRTHRFEYDRVGNLTVWEMPGGKIETRKYDGRHRLVEQIVTAPGRVVLERRYEYDELGRIVGRHDSRKGTARYVYDAVGRLVRFEGHGRPRTEVRYSAEGDALLHGARYAPGHRLTGVFDATLRYDARGFVVGRDRGAIRERFEYLTTGLLRRAVLGDGTEIRYAYDAHSRLVEKTGRGNTTRYAWCADQLWAVVSDGREPTGFLHVPGWSAPAEQIEGGRAFTIHSDPVGRVEELVDEAGNVAWENGAGPWGEGKVGSGGTDCLLGLPGQIHDADTGFHYNRFRWYFAEGAHYLTPDPSGIWGGLDAYTYAQDPVNRADPLGLQCRNKTDDPALYRADRRPPEQICKEGFKPWNPSGTMSLAQHVNGSNHTSPWVSTTYNRDFAVQAKNYGSRHDDDINKQYPGRAGPWIYEIENPGCGVEVDCDPGVVAHAAQFGESSSEQEIAFKKTIPPNKIVGAVNVDTGEIVMC